MALLGNTDTLLARMKSLRGVRICGYSSSRSQRRSLFSGKTVVCHVRLQKGPLLSTRTGLSAKQQHSSRRFCLKLLGRTVLSAVEQGTFCWLVCCSPHICPQKRHQPCPASIADPSFELTFEICKRQHTCPSLVKQIQSCLGQTALVGSLDVRTSRHTSRHASSTQPGLTASQMCDLFITGHNLSNHLSQSV